MNEAERETKKRDLAIAENESVRQTTSSIRISMGAIAGAVLVGLMIFGWIMIH